MDKVTIRTDKVLRALLENDGHEFREFRDLSLIPNAYGLIAWTLAVMSTGKMQPGPFDTSPNPEGLIPARNELTANLRPERVEDLHEIYRASDRIAVELRCGTTEACVVVSFHFYPKGKRPQSLAVLEGFLESSGVVYLRQRS